MTTGIRPAISRNLAVTKFGHTLPPRAPFALRLGLHRRLVSLLATLLANALGRRGVHVEERGAVRRERLGGLPDDESCMAESPVEIS